MQQIKILLLTFNLLAGFVTAQTVHATSKEQTQKSSKTVVLDVQNMTCAMCPITVKAALKKVDGVQNATVDFGNKTANVIFNPKKTNIDALIKSTTNAGYPSSLRTDQ
jgi:mercuric ion binding protein